jgi:hypothetical protein
MLEDAYLDWSEAGASEADWGEGAGGNETLPEE